MYIAGIDEAGRGPVIGPMVMVIAAIEEKHEFELKTMGVKDSKLLTSVQRKELAEMIRQICKIEVAIVPTEEIDDAVKHPSRNLNILEAETTGKLIDALVEKIGEKNLKHVVLDCPSINPKGYLDEMAHHVKSNVKLIAEHKADKNHLTVGAASIVAKVIRDEEIEKLKRKHNVDFGSGYPGDEKTSLFVRRHYKDYDFFRKTWSTYKNAVAENSQSTLVGFGTKKTLSHSVKNKLKKLKTLIPQGFRTAKTSTTTEVIRLKTEDATITLYTTGRVLIQGKGKDYWQDIIDKMLL